MEREKFDKAPEAPSESIVDLIRRQQDEIAGLVSQIGVEKEFQEKVDRIKEQLDAQKAAIEAEIRRAIESGKMKIRIGASGMYTGNFEGLDVTDTSPAALRATQEWVEENYGSNLIEVKIEKQNYPGSGGMPAGSAKYLVLSWEK